MGRRNSKLVYSSSVYIKGTTLVSIVNRIKKLQVSLSTESVSAHWVVFADTHLRVVNKQGLKMRLA